MKSRLSTSERLLRVVPIAAMSAAVVIVLAMRASRSPSPSHQHGVATTTITTTFASSSSSASADTPLRGPSPPPKMEIAKGWWRSFHGGAHHTHRAGARGPRAINVGYRVSVDGPVAAQITASPDEATLYVGTLHGQLHALSRADGSKRWSSTLGDRVYSTPLVHDDGTIYVGTDAKKLVALSSKGDVIFRLDTDGEADSAPTFGKDGTIVFAAGNQVHAARRAGDLAWRFAAKSKVFTAPAVTDDGFVVFGSQDHHVYALGAGGVQAWSVDLGADVDGAPAIADDGSSIYVGTDNGEVVSLEAKTGKVAWRARVGGFVRGALSIARNGDVLAGTYGPVPRMARIGPDGVIRGAFAIKGTGAREFGIHGGALEDDDGVLYFGAQDDAVYAIGPDGTLRWRFATGADVDAPLTMLSDGSLVVPSEDGTVTLLLP